MAGRYSPKIVTDGLVLLLDAGNRKSYPGSGTSVNDLSGNNRTCILVNGPTVTFQGFILDGTNDYAYISHGGGLSFSTGDFTVCVWNACISNFLGRYGGIITNDNTTDNAWKIYKDNVNSFFSSRVSSSTGNFPSFTVGRWHFYAFTFSSGTVRMYFDGSECGSFSGASNPASYNNLAFGSYRYNDAINGTYLNNQSIGPVQLYNRSLSATEILQNYDATKGRFGF